MPDTEIAAAQAHAMNPPPVPHPSSVALSTWHNCSLWSPVDVAVLYAHDCPFTGAIVALRGCSPAGFNSSKAVQSSICMQRFSKIVFT